MAVFNTVWDKADGSSVFMFTATNNTITTYITVATDLETHSSDLGTVKLYRGTADSSNPVVTEIPLSYVSTETTYKIYQGSYTFSLDEWISYRQTGNSYVTVWVSNNKSDSNSIFKQLDVIYDLYPSITSASVVSNHSDNTVFIAGVTTGIVDVVAEGYTYNGVTASITRVTASVAGNTINLTLSNGHWTGTIPRLSVTGSRSVTIQVTDEYTIATTTSRTVLYQTHDNPTITTDIFRCDQDGTRNAGGAYISVAVYADSVPSALGISSVYIEGRSGGGTSLISQYINSGQTYIFGGSISATESYYFEIEATDDASTYGGTALSTTVTVGQPQIIRAINFHDGGDGAAFGKLASANLLDSTWDIHTDGNLQADGNASAKTLTLTDTTASEHLKFSRQGQNYISIPFDNSGALNLGKGSTLADTLYVWNTNGYRPNTDNALALGASSYRWKSAHIGTADTYGDSMTPIYWNAGVPTAISKQMARFDFAGANTAKSFTVPSTSSHLIVVASAAANMMAAFLILCTSNGSIVKMDINIGSAMTVATSTNTLTLTPTGSNRCYVEDIIIYGDPISA